GCRCHGMDHRDRRLPSGPGRLRPYLVHRILNGMGWNANILPRTSRGGLSGHGTTTAESRHRLRRYGEPAGVTHWSVMTRTARHPYCPMPGRDSPPVDEHLPVTAPNARSVATLRTPLVRPTPHHPAGN